MRKSEQSSTDKWDALAEYPLATGRRPQFGLTSDEGGGKAISLNSGEAAKNSKPVEKYAALICNANFNHENADNVTPLSREQILATYEAHEERLAKFKKYLHQTLDIVF